MLTQRGYPCKLLNHGNVLHCPTPLHHLCCSRGRLSALRWYRVCSSLATLSLTNHDGKAAESCTAVMWFAHTQCKGWCGISICPPPRKRLVWNQHLSPTLMCTGCAYIPTADRPEHPHYNVRLVGYHASLLTKPLVFALVYALVYK